MFIQSTIKVTLQWILRLSLMVSLGFACFWLLLTTAFDDSSRYYKEFIPIIIYASGLQTLPQQQTSSKQQFEDCIKTVKVFTRFDAVKKCTYRIR